MSDTTLPRADAVRAYVARVRRALADLTPEDVDELTTGMEADLAEMTAEGADLHARLGSPEQYAADLRAAADLPPRTDRRPGVRVDLRTRWADLLTNHPRLRATWDFTRTLQPAWWVVRGIAATWLLHQVLGLGSLAGMLTLLATVPGSVILGLHHRPRLHPIVLGVLNTVAALVALLTGTQALGVVLGYSTGAPDYSYESGPSPDQHGLMLDGGPVANLYVYDAQGRPVPRARAYADDGRPVVVTDTIGPDKTVAAVDGFGQAYPNTFPVAAAGTNPWHPVLTQDQVASGATVWMPPESLPALTPLLTATPTATPSGTPSGTAAPTSTAPAASPTASDPTATPTPVAPTSSGTTATPLPSATTATPTPTPTR